MLDIDFLEKAFVKSNQFWMRKESNPRRFNRSVDSHWIFRLHQSDSFFEPPIHWPHFLKNNCRSLIFCIHQGKRILLRLIAHIDSDAYSCDWWNEKIKSEIKKEL